MKCTIFSKPLTNPVFSALIFLTSMMPQKTFCQDEGVFNRINGSRIKNNVLIYLDKDLSFFYSIDDEKQTHTLDADMIFNVKNNHKNDFQIYCHFYNPLKTTIKSSQKDIDDPSYKAITDFISKLPTGATQAAEENKDKVAFKAELNMTELELSVLLNQWIFEFTKGFRPDTIKKRNLTDKFNTTATIINDIATTENFLYSEIAIPESNDDKKRTVNGWVKFTADNLYKAEDDYDKFDKILTTASDARKALSETAQRAQDKLKAVQTLLTSDFDNKIAPLLEKLTPAEIKDFKKYSSVFAKTLTTTTQSEFTAQHAAIVQDSALISRLTLFCEDFNGESVGGNIIFKGFKKDFNDKLDWKTTTMKEITYTATALKNDGTEDLKKTSSKKFTIAKKLGLYPFISTGVLYTNFSYPEYAVKNENGKGTVAKTDDVKVNMRPTVFLNLLIDNWGIAYPFAQVGITTGVGDALFPAGVGLSFGSSFSISWGVIFGYHKDLNKLTEGGTVNDDAELKADLTNKAVFKPYFSVNYNLGKK